MRPVLPLLACFLAVSFLQGDEFSDKYYEDFWYKGRESKSWESRRASSPLDFEKFLEKEPENIKKISRWSKNECSEALRFLVERDKTELVQHRRSFFQDEAAVSQECAEEGNVLDVEENFGDIISFALFNIDTFRSELKSRLEALGENADDELRKAIRRLLASHSASVGESEEDFFPTMRFFF